MAALRVFCCEFAEFFRLTKRLASHALISVRVRIAYGPETHRPRDWSNLGPRSMASSAPCTWQGIWYPPTSDCRLMSRRIIVDESRPPKPLGWSHFPLVAPVARLLCRELIDENEYLRTENRILRSTLARRIAFYGVRFGSESGTWASRKCSLRHGVHGKPRS